MLVSASRWGYCAVLRVNTHFLTNNNNIKDLNSAYGGPGTALSALYVLTDSVLPKANEVTTTVIPILQMRKMKHRVYTADGEEPRIKLRPCASIADAMYIIFNFLLLYGRIVASGRSCLQTAVYQR